MPIVHENFTEDHGVFTYSGSNISFDYAKGDLEVVKTATGWSAGFVQSTPTLLTVNTEFEVKFEALSNRVGNAALDSTITYYTLGITLDRANPDFSPYLHSYGIYVEGGTIKVQNGGTYGDYGAPELGKSYTLKLKPNSNSELEIGLRGPGLTSNDPLMVIPGPFLNRNARFQFNMYSIDTVQFKNFIIKS